MKATLFFTGHYGRMFPAAPAADDLYLQKMEALGRSLLVPGEAACACAVNRQPVGYTYFGQLIDHDLTFDATPLASAQSWSAEEIPNRRTPWLDLDHIYGGGPSRSPALFEGDEGAERFRLVGTRDLPMGDHYKLLGDQSIPARERDFRDLENAVILQFRVLLMRLHNLAIEQDLGCGLAEVEGADGNRFARAARLVRWQYQWLVRNDYLPRIVAHSVFHRVQRNGPRFRWPAGKFFIPVEFSTAAFRFGHSLVRENYQVNQHSRLELRELISPRLATAPLPDELLIDWRYFFSIARSPRPAPARGLDTRIAPALGNLMRHRAEEAGHHRGLEVASNETAPAAQALPAMTLQRGAKMRLASGQEVARALGVETLTAPQLTGAPNDSLREADASGQILLREGLMERTPLFYYILREAELSENCGNHLGLVGSQIVADVIEGAFRHDPDSYWQFAPDWEPPGWEFPRGESRRIESMGELIEAVGN